MAALRVSSHASVGSKPGFSVKSTVPVLNSRTRNVVAKASKTESQDLGFEAGKILALSTIASQWALSGQAQAASELSQIAAGDSRFSIIATLFIPVVGWVAYNILQPALNQLGRMDQLRDSKSLIGAAALGAALPFLLASDAQAANELSSTAAGSSDGRLGIILTLFVPVVGWVLFNILQPALNQLGKMNEKLDGTPKSTKKRGLGVALGLGAALSYLAADNADAVSEISQLAANDNRLSILLTLFIPPVGWVLFNIAQPARNQLGRMEELRGAQVNRRGLVGAVASGAALTLLSAHNADAASELSQIAASDSRFSIILTLFVPVVGWVLFNILQPALNQLNKMDAKRK